MLKIRSYEKKQEKILSQIQEKCCKTNKNDLPIMDLVEYVEMKH